MASTTVIIITGIILIVFVIVLLWGMWKLLKWLINKTRKGNRDSNQIPEDVLRDFETAERRMSESNGELTPQQILWDLANAHKELRRFENNNIRTERRLKEENGKRIEERRIRNGGGIPEDSNGIARVEKKRFPQLPTERTYLQGNNDFYPPRDKYGNTGTQRGNNNSFIRRLRKS